MKHKSTKLILAGIAGLAFAFPAVTDETTDIGTLDSTAPAAALIRDRVSAAAAGFHD